MQLESIEGVEVVRVGEFITLRYSTSGAVFEGPYMTVAEAREVAAKLMEAQG